MAHFVLNICSLFFEIYVAFIFKFVNSAEVAKNISEDSYGLIFGVNTFIALALQSVLTLVVVSDTGMALEIRPQVSDEALALSLVSSKK
jgi:hypothetical protein